MVLPIFLLKLIDWILYQLLANSCYRAARKIKNYGFFFIKSPSFSFKSSSSSSSSSSTTTSQNQYLSLIPNVSNKCGNLDLKGGSEKTLVCDIFGTLLRSDDQSLFPYFMLVAFEGGSIFRAFFLLLSYPLLWVLDYKLRLRVMMFISFCGLRLKDIETVGRAVLPKFFLENLHFQAYEILASTGRKVVFTSVPRVMVEGFLKEYLGVDVVVGTELHTFRIGGCNYFTGFLTKSGLLVKHKALREFFGENDKPDIGLIGLSSSLHDHLFISLCKEAYVVNKEEDMCKGNNTENYSSIIMPREKYPKPLVFHDGRLAFFPTPLATLSMFLWLPFGITIAIFRISVGILFPYKIAMLLGCLSGVDIRVKGTYVDDEQQQLRKGGGGGGVLYVCTHRTLLDPVFLSTSLGKPLTAVTYSVSKMSEIIAPIRTVRLTRDRKKDGETMQKLLSEGDLVVCPEGTTCREPYLLRFSSLFAELTDEIVPVAMNTKVSMFYGTTASGLKCLDPIFFLMNPRPSYHVQLLEKVPKEFTCGGGKSSCEVANYIQRQLGDALGFECTKLTRRDKYLMLAGNEGVVHGR